MILSIILKQYYYLFCYRINAYNILIISVLQWRVYERWKYLTLEGIRSIKKRNQYFYF